MNAKSWRWTGVAAGLAILLVPAESRSCGERPAQSFVQFTNRTDCPIHVYLEGRYLGCCESYGSLRAEEERSGDLILVGRFRCDTWGPMTMRVRPGTGAGHTFTEGERVGRR